MDFSFWPTNKDLLYSGENQRGKFRIIFYSSKTKTKKNQVGPCTDPTEL